MNDFHVFIKEDTGPARWPTAAETDDLCFILGPTWSRERTNAHKLSLDLHMHTVAHACMDAHVPTK